MEVAGAENVISNSHGSKTEESVKIQNLNDFVFRKVLSHGQNTKSIILEGTLSNKSDSVVLLLEKEPFHEEEVKTLFSNGENKQEKVFENDIYTGYRYLPVSACNGLKVTSIYPATEKHIQKYSYQPIHLLNETSDLYKTITLPLILKEQFSLQWVYNILEHKSEAERIVFEDSNPETGFILLPDQKWNETDIEGFHMLALVMRRDLLSLRSLTDKELPLLKNIYEKSLRVIEEKYMIPPSFIQAYFHYQPSYYHLHVHFRCIQDMVVEGRVNHSLSTVINNITLLPNYYQLATLPFLAKETDSLFASYESIGIVKRVGKLNKEM